MSNNSVSGECSRDSIAAAVAAISAINEKLQEKVTIARISELSGLDVDTVFPEEILHPVLRTTFVVEGNEQIAVNWEDLGFITAERIRTNQIDPSKFTDYWYTAVKYNNIHIAEALFAQQGVPIPKMREILENINYDTIHPNILAMVTWVAAYELFVLEDDDELSVRKFTTWVIDTRMDIDDTPALYMAVRSGRVEIIRLLLEAGAEIDRLDWEQKTPLHIATEKGSANVVQLLLEFGANPNLEDDEYATPLLNACHANNTEMILMLIEAGAYVNVIGIDTPLAYAAKYNNEQVVSALLEAGAQIDPEEYTHSPLGLAAQEGHVQMVRTLLEAGANVNAQGSDGFSSLHLGVLSNNVQIVQMLLQAGGDTTLKNRYNETALDVAKRNKCFAVVDFLCIHTQVCI